MLPPNFSVRVDHYHHQFPSQEIEAKMAELTDAINSLREEVRETATNTRSKVDELNARITALEAKPVVTPEDIEAINAIRAEVDAIDPTKPAVLPPENPTPEIPQEEV